MFGSHPSRWIALLIVGSMTALGCVSSDTSQQGETGSLSLDLMLADGVTINEVDWALSGNGMDPMAGTIDTSDPNATASVEVFGLPPGEDYVVVLEATTEDGATTCRGSGTFDIAVGELTDVMVMLNCKLPEVLGGVRVNGKFNICAQLAKVVVSPLQTSVGGNIDLASLGEDAEEDSIKYDWSATGGTIDDSNAASTTYTCREVGKQAITITISDDDFEYCMDDWTVAVTCVPGDDLECVEDDDCDKGEVCFDNECVPDLECVDDDGCETGEICVDNKCVPDLECIDDDGCDTGEICVDNECVPDLECIDDDGCDLEEICVGNVCVGDPDLFCDTGICVSDTQARLDCIDTFITCLAGNPNEEECIALALLECNECNMDTDCAAEEICEENACVPAPDCISPGDCIDGNPCTIGLCTDGMCSFDPVDGGSCEVSAGVPGTCSGGSCVGLCVGEECTSDNDCIQDGTCDDQTGQCVDGDPEAENEICNQDGGKVCDGAGTCVECNADNQCDVELNEICVDNSCQAGAQACGSQTKTVSVGCTNNVTTAQSPFPFQLTVDAPVAIVGGAAFSVNVSGLGFFPEFFLDAAQGVVCGGIRQAELLEFVSTVVVRSGATGADVPLGVDVGALSPGPQRFCNFPFDQVCTCPGGTAPGSTCAQAACLGGICGTEGLYQDLPVIDGTPNSAGGCDFDASGCPGTPGPPTDCDCSACAALGTAKADQCAANGFCQNGALGIPMETAVGNYTAAASGSVLWGWSGTPATVPGLFLCPDAACTNDGAIDGCWQLPVAASPVDPVGLRVNAGGLVVPIRCAMGEDGGECTTAPPASAGTGIGCLSAADCQAGETCEGIGEDDDIICPTPDANLIACPIN